MALCTVRQTVKGDEKGAPRLKGQVVEDVVVENPRACALLSAAIRSEIKKQGGLQGVLGLSAVPSAGSPKSHLQLFRSLQSMGLVGALAQCPTLAHLDLEGYAVATLWPSSFLAW